MRVIKFRGQMINSNKWVYGSLIKDRFGKYYILYVRGNFKLKVQVNPKTIGQYTNCKDIKGTKIYEGDIIKDEYDMKFVVILDEFENRFMGVTMCDEIWNERQGDVRFIRNYSIEEHGLFVIGTKYTDKKYINIQRNMSKNM
ncbi:MAG: hypothetical protein K0R54_191 [Clostridiaceae bacterium]|jgi:hypothetical protein|nr:hypothetical protein [Clostridiaceae bacterium]